MQDALILLAGHFLADFPLQPRAMVQDKAKRTALGYLTLLAHASTHGLVLGILLLFLGYPDPMTMALIVFATHFWIDVGKIRGAYGVLTDQCLHWLVIVLLVLCKHLL